MRIGQVARRAGVGVETVRFYERKGLIERPLRPTDGGYRNYPQGTVPRIRFVRSAQELGFSLSEVAELLQLASGETARCEDVRRQAEMKRLEVTNRIEKLERIRQALDRLIAACPGAGPVRQCSILDAIHSGELCLDAITKGEKDERRKAKN